MSNRSRSARCVPWDTRAASANSIAGLAMLRAGQGYTNDAIADALWSSEHLQLDRQSMRDRGRVGNALRRANDWRFQLEGYIASPAAGGALGGRVPHATLEIPEPYMYVLTAENAAFTTGTNGSPYRTLVIYSDVSLTSADLILRAQEEGEALSEACSYFGRSEDWASTSFQLLLAARRPGE